MTDNIKAAFEQYATSKTSMDLTKDSQGFYVDSYTIAFFSLYQMGYQQGQRDLVAGMEQVMYRSSNQDGYYRFYEACKTTPSFLDEERYLGYTVRALAFVPELEK